MTNKLVRRGLILAASIWLLGCVSGGTDSNEPEAEPVSGVPESSTTPWSPNASTTGVPTFGKNCRYAAESVFSSPTNQALDDTFSFTVTENGGLLSIEVRDEGQTLLQATNIALEQGLKDKSYRKASGTAMWSTPSKTGEVIDGTLCFSSKLGTNTNVDAEFSLVMKLGEGVYESVSGVLTIPTEASSNAPVPSVNSENLNIDL